MRRRLLILSIALIAVGCQSGPKSDIVGSWSGTVEKMPISFTFKQDGTFRLRTEMKEEGTDMDLSMAGTYTVEGNKIFLQQNSHHAEAKNAESKEVADHFNKMKEEPPPPADGVEFEGKNKMTLISPEGKKTSFVRTG
jgi:alpha-L-fucosidase